MDVVALSPTWSAWLGRAEAPDSASGWLHDAPAQEAESAGVRIKALQLTQLLARPSERAVACHNFVRSLKLHFGGNAARDVAHVLAAGSGTALEKSDLLVALLRCCGIPARLRICSMRPGVFRGLTDQDSPVLHPLVEAYLGSRWLTVDTHHMDIALALGARVKLINESQRCGYGVHLDGATHWDGTKDALAFMCLSEPATVPLRDWGVFHHSAELRKLVAEFRGLSGRPSPFAGLRASSRASKLRFRGERSAPLHAGH